ncbi:hypothetical protein SGPA1_10932 [Streptomyces misionensis JCM 4497]
MITWRAAEPSSFAYLDQKFTIPWLESRGQTGPVIYLLRAGQPTQGEQKTPWATTATARFSTSRSPI